MDPDLVESEIGPADDEPRPEHGAVGPLYQPHRPQNKGEEEEEVFCRQHLQYFTDSDTRLQSKLNE